MEQPPTRRLSFGQAIVGQIGVSAAAILLLLVATTPLLVLSALVLWNLVGPLYERIVRFTLVS